MESGKVERVISLRFNSTERASNVARIIAEKISPPDALGARRSMVVQSSSVAPSPYVSLYLLISANIGIIRVISKGSLMRLACAVTEF